MIKNKNYMINNPHEGIMSGDHPHIKEPWSESVMRMNDPLMSQPLDSDTIKEMKTDTGKFIITKEEQNRAICTHKDPDRNNEFSFIDENDGSVTCYICGANFVLKKYTNTQVEEVVKDVLGIIQNIKTMHLDASIEESNEYKDAILLAKSISGYYKRAANNFDVYDTSGIHSLKGGE